ncbi:MAG: LysR family transcriptional regulator [Steroidobacteraceae bacterium]
MDLKQLRYFVAVAEERNFSRAARRLHLSQPPLSQQIAALEAELGVRLLDRTNRGASMTVAGAALYEEARAVLSRVVQLRERVRDAGQGDVGTLAVGFVTIADYGALPPALKAFRARWPRVEVQLHELTTDAQQQALHAGRLDLGVALGPVDDASLSFQRLHREPLALAVPVTSRARRSDACVELRSFADAEFIVPPRELAPGLYDLILATCRAAGFSPRISQQARQMQTVISLVACGLGVALVPGSMRGLRLSGVRYLKLKGRQGQLELGLLRPRGLSNPLADHFAQALAAASPRRLAAPGAIR